MTYPNGRTMRCLWKPTLARVLASLDCFDGVNMRQAIEDAQNWLAARDVAA